MPAPRATGRFRPPASGRLARVRWLGSPNQDARPAGVEIDTLIVHFISLPPGRFGGPLIEQLFCNRLPVGPDPLVADLAALRVSSHLLLRRNGEAIQFVSCDARAWHAGQSSLGARQAFNDFSIGIELEGDEHHRFSRAQYHQLEQLIQRLRRRYPIRWILGHADIAPGRKIDPGPHFDWSALLASRACDGLMRPVGEHAHLLSS